MTNTPWYGISLKLKEIDGIILALVSRMLFCVSFYSHRLQAGSFVYFKIDPLRKM